MGYLTGGILFRGYGSGSEEAKPSGFVPIAIPSFSRGRGTGRWQRSIWEAARWPVTSMKWRQPNLGGEHKVVAAKVTGDPNTSFPSLIPMVKMVSQLIPKQEYIFIGLRSRGHTRARTHTRPNEPHAQPIQENTL
jgi:hypothetical protein